MRFGDPISQFPQNTDRIGSNIVVVLHHQDGFRTARLRVNRRYVGNACCTFTKVALKK